MHAVEEWRAVAGWEGAYEVSSHGRVRTVARYIERRGGTGLNVKGRIRKASQLASGHMALQLRSGDRAETLYVHRLVVESFIGAIPEGMEVRHLDGDPTNNHLPNLAIGTRTEQRLDDVRNGVHWQAGFTHCKRGHLLEPPYLVDSRYERDGHRICKPCNWASMRKNRLGWSEDDIARNADYYAQRLTEVGSGWTPRMG